MRPHISTHHDSPDDLLKPLRSLRVGDSASIEGQDGDLQATESNQFSKVTSPAEALNVLKSKPNFGQLIEVFRYLDTAGIEGTFKVKSPGPQATQILQALVTTTIPDYWPILTSTDLNSNTGDDEAKLRGNLKKTLLSTLRSVAGIGALLTHIEFTNSLQNNPFVLLPILLHALRDVLGDGGLLQKIWPGDTAMPFAQRKAIWTEITTLLAGSKVLSVARGAYISVNTRGRDDPKQFEWISDNEKYPRQLGVYMAAMAIKLQPSDFESFSLLAQFFGRALSLGYPGIFRFLFKSSFHAD